MKNFIFNYYYDVVIILIKKNLYIETLKIKKIKKYYKK